MAGTGSDGALDAVLANRDVVPAFQPVVDLATGATVGYEALARGPAGELRSPAALFAAARRADRLAELDRLCQERALEVAAAHGLPASVALFVNVEPEVLDEATPVGASDLTLVVEFTERSLTLDPARLIAVARALRAGGRAIALDDVGADPASLALMPFLRPDVVKLDMRLVQQQPGAEAAEVMTAVTAYAEESGARVLAEGIETRAHELAARSMGAQLGQGWRYGRPRRLHRRSPRATTSPAPSPVAVPPIPRLAPPSETHPSIPDTTDPARTTDPLMASPFDAAARHIPPRDGSRPLLLAVSRLLESQAAELRGLAVVLSTFEDARWFTADSARVYTSLASTTAFVAVFGAGIPPVPAPGVRGADIPDGDPIRREWDVVGIGPHVAAALLARERVVSDAAAPRAFDYVLTYQRPLVLEVAGLLMGRALPATPGLRAVPD